MDERLRVSNFEDLGVSWPSNVHLYDVKRLNMTAAIRPDWSLWMKVSNFEDLGVRWPSKLHLYEVKRLNMTAYIGLDWSLRMKVRNFEDLDDRWPFICPTSNVYT